MAGAEWKNTLAYRLSAEMGLKEVKNMQSMYYHPEKKLTVPCHVDDPLCKSENEEGRKWFHGTLDELFDTKGGKILSPAQALDYLSIRISTNDKGDIMLDNQAKIEEYLEQAGLADANPAKYPITKTTVKMLAKNAKSGIYDPQELHEETEKWLGQGQWLAATTHPVLAPVVSIYASIIKSHPAGSHQALKTMLRYMVGVKDRCLVRRHDGNSGWKIESEASV